MRVVLNQLDIDGTVIIGEGEKDNAPMLFNGEKLGRGGTSFDIAVDPIDGTTLTAFGLDNALSVIALSERGTMFDPGPIMYMKKIAVGPEALGSVDLDAPVKDNLASIARSKSCKINDLTVVILDRPRHDELIADVRNAGARIKLIRDGDVAGAIAASWDSSGTDVLMGIGGTPEAVITAAALSCLGGEIIGRLHPVDDQQKQLAIDMGYDVEKVLTTKDLVSGDDVFFAATGITNGDFLDGVRYTNKGAFTQSLSMRSKSGTVRTITARHNLAKLGEFASVTYQ
jgi:fructose-1,6-bisphosphatase II